MIIIDRFEGSYAVCEWDEEEEMISIARSLIVAPAAEGDVLVQKGNRFVPDPEATKARRARIASLMNGLFD